MKTRNENKTVLVKVIDLSSGECFTTKRTNAQENGIYVKIDKKSGAIISEPLGLTFNATPMTWGKASISSSAIDFALEKAFEAVKHT